MRNTESVVGSQVLAVGTIPIIAAVLFLIEHQARVAAASRRQVE